MHFELILFVLWLQIKDVWADRRVGVLKLTLKTLKRQKKKKKRANAYQTEENTIFERKGIFLFGWASFADWTLSDSFALQGQMSIWEELVKEICSELRMKT